MSATVVQSLRARQRLFGWRAVMILLVALAVSTSTLFIALDVARFHRIGESFGLVIGPGGAIMDANPRINGILSRREPVNLSKMTLRDRLVVASAAVTPFPGQIVRIFQGLPGRTRQVVVRVKRAANERQIQIAIVAETLGSGVFLIMAALLAIRRPGATTLFLLAYAVGLCSQYRVTAFAPNWMLIAAQSIQDTFGTFMPYALLIFACLFPNGRPKGWLVYCVPVALILGTSNVVIQLYGDYSFYALSVPSELFDGAYGLYRALEVALPISICAVLVTTYLGAAPPVRQRVKWLIAATLVTQAVYPFAAYWNYYIIGHAATQSPLFAAELTAMTIPVLFAGVIDYVVLRYNVLDVGLVAGRAFVLGILIALMVAAFIAIEWRVGQQLRQEAAAMVVNGCIALLGAVIFASWMPRLEQIVDAVFFRERRAAERRLRLEGEALQRVGTEDALYSRIAEAPVRVLDLTSSAIFVVEGERAYIATTIGLKERFILENVDLPAVISIMRSSRRTMSIAETRDAAHVDLDLPVAAMPLTIGRTVRAFALYGAHRSGEDLDEAERRNLDAFSRAAAAVYQRFELEALRGERLLEVLESDRQPE